MKTRSAKSALQERFLDVNAYGVLRIPASLWLSLVVLSRHWILVLMVLFSARSRSSTLVLGEEGVPWRLMLTELPVVMLALAAWYRQPGAPRIVSLIWRRGRELMALTAVLNVAWTVRLLASSEYWSLWPELFLGSCALLDITIVVAMYRDAYFRQLFREFPQAAPKEETSSTTDSQGGTP